MKPLMTLGLLLGTCLFATAQDAAPQRPERPNRPARQLPPELIKEYDKDGDGKLSDDERKAMQEAVRAKREAQQKADLAKYDKDGDGKLSAEERKTMMSERQAELLKKYDADGDGKLSSDERQKIPAGERMFGGRGGRGPGAEGGRGGRGGRGQGGPQGGAPEKPADAPKAE